MGGAWLPGHALHASALTKRGAAAHGGAPDFGLFYALSVPALPCSRPAAMENRRNLWRLAARQARNVRVLVRGSAAPAAQMQSGGAHGFHGALFATPFLMLP